MKLYFHLLIALGITVTASAQSAYYLPPGVTNIRAMITGGVTSPSNPSAAMQTFCATNRVGLAQLTTDLPTIATATGHPEIANAPMVLTGNSAASVGAVQTAIANPSRIVAIIGTHGAMLAMGNDGFNVNRGGDTPGDILTVNAAAVVGIPQVHTFDNGDGFVNPVTLQGFVEYGRSLGSPWHFLIHNDGNHSDSTTALNTAILPWLSAILDLRLPASAGTGNGSVTLNAITESSGWLGDTKTKAIASFASYSGDKAKANWFPNQSVATAWAGYHFAPSYTIPAQPIIAPSGIIADLTVLDPNNNDTTSGVGWRINSNFKECDQLYNDIKWYVVGAPPLSIAGLDWIRPIIKGKKFNDYTADPIATFRVTAEAEVFIAHSDGIAPKPAWMAGFTDTGDNLQVTSASLTTTSALSVFKKTVAANSTVTLGANGGNGAFYLTFVKPLGTAALPSVSVSASDASATEGGDSAAFTFTRTGATTDALTVSFSVSGTATSGSDFNALGTALTIPAGQSSAVLTVTPINDAALESAETVVLNITSNAAYNLGTPASAAVSIADDDSPPLPVVTVIDSNTNAAEPSNTGAFTFSRTGDTTNPLTVNFSLSGTATSGTDYTNLGTSIVIPAGQTSAVLTITPIDDTSVEGSETVTLSISTAATYALGTITTASVDIADNDTSALPIVSIVATDADAGEPSNGGAWTITRTGSVTSALAVSFTTSGTAPRAQDYTLSGVSGTTLTIPANQASATITLNVTNDTTVESTETAICTISANAAYTVGSPSSATISITDDDSGGTAQTVSVAASDASASEPSDGAAWTLTRTGTTTAALTINFTTSGTATRTTDYTVDAPPTGTTLTFPAGQTTLVVPLTVVDDTEQESTETAVLTVGTGSGYTVGSQASATINLADDDTPVGGANVVTLSSTDLVASEAPGNTATITFTRSGSTTNALTLSLGISGNATNGVDVPTVPSGLVIDAGQTTATLTVSTTEDSIIEGAETLAVTLLPSANYTLGATTTLGVIISDNENATPLTNIGITFVTRVNGANTRDIKLNVYRPATGTGPWPVVIYYPGGGWTSQNEGSISQFFINLTAHGYAVVSANYVTSSFAKWPAQIQDAKAAVRWVRANAATYGFDPTRIGVTGGSSGGHIAAYVGVSGGLKTARIGSEVVDLVGNVGGNSAQSDIVQCAAPYFPPTDLLVMDHYPTPDVPDHNGSSPETGLIGPQIQTVPEKTGTANPITLIRPGLPAFMLVHGSADRSVNFNQSELMNGALVKAAQPVTFWPVQGGGHGTGVSDSQEIAALTKAFFDRQLQGITTNALPVASFTATTLTGAAPLTITFNGSASSDSDGVITRYSWATGDDEGASTAVMTYTYTRPGIYPVCLAVRDDKGGTHSITANVIVSPAGTTSASPPTISISGPTDGFMYARTGDLCLQASVVRGIATVSSVEYFLNGQPIAFDSTTPYNTTLGQLPPGRYTAHARASDSSGAATWSAPITFTVMGEADLFPEPSLSSNQLSLDYYRFTDGSLTYNFERSPDLFNWTPFVPNESVLTPGTQVEERRAIDPLSTSGADRRFLRIRVQPAP